MKLSKRLKTILKMIDHDYTHIWDCCCDHGFIGMRLLAREAANNIHFVDIVPEIIRGLETKLKLEQSSSNTLWTTHCQDVAELPLDKYPGNHLLIIAGIGGDLMIEMLDKLQQKHSDMNIDFLLCPVHRQYAVRQKLIELNYSLKDEKLIEDKRRFYELLFVSSTENEKAKINPTGEKIWEAQTPEQVDVIEKYLATTINHYRQMQKGNSGDTEQIIRDYLARNS